MEENLPQNIEVIVEPVSEADELRMEVASIRLDVTPSLPLTEVSLQSARDNIDVMREAKKQMQAVSPDIEPTITLLGEAKDLELKMEFCLEAIHRYDASGRYAMALAQCDYLEALACTLLSEEPLHFQKMALEIAAWTRCSLFVHKGEANIRNGAPALTEEEFETLARMVEELPLGLHGEHQKKIMLDRVYGFRLYAKARRHVNEEDSFEAVHSSFELIRDYKQRDEEPSTLTKRRARYLYILALNEYNRLCINTFDVAREYKDAVALFRLRDNVLLNEVEHPVYHDSKDEEDFHIRFLIREGTLMEDDAFAMTADAYAHTENADIETKVLARLHALPDLSETKSEALRAAIAKLPFERLITVLSIGLDHAMNLERQQFVWNLIDGCNHREIDLCKYGEILLNCKQKIDKTLQKPFQLLLNDLMRSPRARKIRTKSELPCLYALTGDAEDYKEPLGKPMPRTVARPWDFALKGMYVALAIIFPIVLLAVAEVSIYLGLIDSILVQYYLLAAPILALFFIMCAIIARFGRDERGSAVARRLILLVCIVAAGVSALFWALAPNSFATRLCLPFAGFALAGGLMDILVFKDRSKGFSIALLILWLLGIGASIAMSILAMYQGAYAFF